MSNTINDLHSAYKDAIGEGLYYRTYAIRYELVRRLLKEELNVLDYSLYRNLLEEEKNIQFKNIDKNTQILNLIPLEKAWHVHSGYQEYNPVAILNEICDVVQYGTSRTSIEYTKWVISQLLGLDDNEVKNRLVLKLSVKPLCTGFMTVNKESVEDLLQFSQKVEEAIDSSPPRPEKYPAFEEHVVRFYMTIYLLLNRLGDEANAKKHLAKATEWNTKGNEMEMLVLFLENILLNKK